MYYIKVSFILLNKTKNFFNCVVQEHRWSTNTNPISNCPAKAGNVLETHVWKCWTCGLQIVKSLDARRLMLLLPKRRLQQRSRNQRARSHNKLEDKISKRTSKHNNTDNDKTCSDSVLRQKKKTQTALEFVKVGISSTGTKQYKQIVLNFQKQGEHNSPGFWWRVRNKVVRRRALTFSWVSLLAWDQC